MKVSQLKYNHENPRRISSEQLDKLCTSIQSLPKMMELRPIVYDPATMYVLGGNQRLAAIRKMGMKEIPDTWAIAATDLTPEQQKEFVLRDNVQFGDWDMEMLSAEFAEFDFDEIGIDIPDIENELKDIDEKEKLIQPIKNVHYLISVPIDSVIDMSQIIKDLKNIDGIQIQQSQN